MDLGLFLIDIGSRLLVGFIFAIINALILREIVVLLFKLKDDTMATALHVSVWLSVFIFIMSYIPITILVNFVAVVLNYILFMVLVKQYYKISWKKSVLLWLVWFLIYIVLGAIVILVSVLV